MLLAMVALLAPENARAQSDEEKASAQLQALRSDISRINREISSANKRKNDGVSFVLVVASAGDQSQQRARLAGMLQVLGVHHHPIR